MVNVEIDLTDKELEIAELYAAQKGMSVEEAIKQALFERIGKEASLS